MKKIYVLMIMTICMFAVTIACSVNGSTYSVTFQNNSDKDVTLYFGNFMIYAARGTTVTYYYSSENTNAQISFNKEVTLAKLIYNVTFPRYQAVDNGKEVKGMEQKFNFQYNVNLNLNNGIYTWMIDAVYVGNSAGITYPRYLF